MDKKILLVDQREWVSPDGSAVLSEQDAEQIAAYYEPARDTEIRDQ